MSELTDCPVCMESFSSPLVLAGCGHTFCRRCLEQLPGPQLCCPTCRRVSRFSDARPNFALQAVLESMVSGGAITRATVEVASATSAYGPVRRTPSQHRTVPYSTEAAPPAVAASLERWQVPYGLEKLLKEEATGMRRAYILDNSGSMSVQDGHILNEVTGIESPCSRWEEVCHMAINHADWNVALGVRSEYHLLNSISGPRHVCVEGPQHLDQLRSLLQRGVSGTTPLVARLRDVHARLCEEPCSKRVLIIATDGVPNEGKTAFVHELRRLIADNIHVVLRLCCDDNSVVSFYSDVDADLELMFDLLDDAVAESKEIAKVGNSFLTYAPILHKVREAGCYCRVFDILDERKLTHSEIYLLAELLLRYSADDAILPREPKAFLEEVGRRLLEQNATYLDVTKKRHCPLFDVNKLRVAMGLGNVRENLLNKTSECTLQ